MALTRKFLSALGIEAEKVDEIITAHAETVDGLKEQIKQYKEDADKLPAIQQELEDLKAKSGDDTFEQKYKDMEKKYNDLVKENEQKETTTKIKEAYKALLKDAGVSEKRLESVLKVTDISAMKLDKDGKLEGANDLTKNIKSEWADFIEVKGEQGANPATPPDNNSGNPAKTGRAKELANNYFANLYGVKKEGT